MKENQKINILYDKLLKRLQVWGTKHFIGLIIFNLVIMMLILLRSAGYFEPYYLISINLIVLVAIVLSIFLLGARSNSIFMLTICFLLFGMLFKIFHIDIWAERMGIYLYESMVIGVIMLCMEGFLFVKIQKEN